MALFSIYTIIHTLPEHILIASNLVHIRGMKESFFEWLSKAGCNINSWKYQWRYFADHDTMMMDCDGRCRFCHKCNHKKNIYQTIQKSIIRERAEQYVPINESYNTLELNLRNAINTKMTNEIILLPAQTGIGKTHAYLEAMKETDVPLIIAVPTVDLKKEVAEKAGNTATELVSLKELPFKEYQLMEIQDLYNDGFFKEAKEKIKELAKEIPVNNKYFQELVDRYLKGTSIIDATTGNLIMTHTQLMFIKEDISRYTLIIDEDILFTILKNTKTVSVSSVEKAIANGWISGPLLQSLRKLIDSKDGTYLRIESHCYSEYISLKKQMTEKCPGNLNDLLRAGAAYIYTDNNERFIRYFTPNTFPNTKTIILSATLSEDIYKLYFPNRRIITKNSPPAMYKGKLYQYTYHTMSRTNLKQLIKQFGSYRLLEEKLLNVANDTVDYEIGFKEYLQDFKIQNDRMNYGATTGIDKYKGKNGIIVGTPHMEDSVYKLIGCYLGEDVSDCKQTPHRISHKGWVFTLMSYGNQNLRKLQLYCIDSEIEQAVGRSRLLREDCTVYLFSNYPCEQAIIIDEDYLKQEETDMPQKDIPDQI